MARTLEAMPPVSVRGRARLLVVVLVVSALVGSAACAPSSRATSPKRAPGPPRVLVVGDSTGVFLTFALNRWNGTAKAVRLDSASMLGCGFITMGTEIAAGVERGFDPACSGWVARWQAAIASARPDVIVVAGGFHDITDRRLSAGGPLERIGEPHFDGVLAFHLAVATSVLGSAGVPVLWLTTPPFAERDVAPGGRNVHPMNDPARAALYNQAIRAAVAGKSRQLVVDYAAFMASQPGGSLDRSIRPDGMHVDGAGQEVVGRWLGTLAVFVYAWR